MAQIELSEGRLHVHRVKNGIPTRALQHYLGHKNHSAHGQVHRNGTGPVQKLLEELTLVLGHLGAAICGRRQAEDELCFPLNHLGIRFGLALGEHVLKSAQSTARFAHRTLL